MLTAIREIGKWQTTSSKNSGLFISKMDNAKVVFIKLDCNQGEFEGVGLEDYDSVKATKYLYKQGISRGNKPSPIAEITDTARTFDKKVKVWFTNCLKEQLEPADKSFLEKIKKGLQADEIKSKIQEKTNELTGLPQDKRGKILLTVKLNNKYIGEFPVFCKLYNKFSEKKKLKKTTICSVCNEKKEEIYGDNADILKWATIDKPGFITGGFKESVAWKNFPLCSDCRKEIEQGKNFVENKLSQKFVNDGLRYIMIPKLLMGKTEILNEILSIFSDTNKLVSLKKTIKKRITSDENEILEIIAQKKDILTLNFLFMERKSGSSSAEKILQLIEDVFPSRIRKIFETKDYIDKIFEEEFNFSKIRTFYSKSEEEKRDYDLNKYFLEIVDSVFKDRKLDSQFLTKFYMNIIRRAFVKDKYFNFKVKDALMSNLFFEKLGLVNLEEVNNMEQSIFEDVFKKYGNTFASPIRRGLFLTGALTQILLNKQWKERNAKPFMKKLKSLKMNEQDIKALLPAIQNKFEEYNSFGKGKKLVIEEVYKYLFASGDKWNLSIDEINFYFAGGMNLVGKIKDIIYAKVEKDVDLEEIREEDKKEEEPCQK